MNTQPGTSDALRGRRFLVAEDDYLAAAWLTRILEDWGCVVVGPVPTVERGVALAASAGIDAAILDINLRGRHSGAIADAVEAAGCPLIFLTGYTSPPMLPAKYRARRRLYKPVAERELRWALEQVVQGGPEAAPWAPRMPQF